MIAWDGWPEEPIERRIETPEQARRAVLSAQMAALILILMGAGLFAALVFLAVREVIHQ